MKVVKVVGYRVFMWIGVHVENEIKHWRENAIALLILVWWLSFCYVISVAIW